MFDGFLQFNLANILLNESFILADVGTDNFYCDGLFELRMICAVYYGSSAFANNLF